MIYFHQTTEPNGKKIRRVMYQHPGNDVTGIISRSEKVAGACEEVNDVLSMAATDISCFSKFYSLFRDYH